MTKRKAGLGMALKEIPAPAKRRGWIGPLILVLIVLGGGYYGWTRYQDGLAAKAREAQAKSRPPAPIPVTLATTEATASFPVNLTGLGTVQAYNTVIVRTRVDGQIEKVGFREGQNVKHGDVLVQIDARSYQASLDQALAKKLQDETNITNAKADLARYTKLGDYATKQQTDTQASTVGQLTAQIASDQAAIESAQTQLSYTTVTAPIDGLTGFRQVDVGNIVNAATQTGIVTITQIEPISVIYTAPEDQLQDINAALAAGPVMVAAYSTDGQRKLSEGQLEVVNNQVDPTTGTVRLKATFANMDHHLWPGLSVSTRMLVRTLQNVVTVPDDAVQRGPSGLYAYVVDDAGKAGMQPVSISLSEGGRSVITKGLSAGQRVITAGHYRVQPGALVADAKPNGRQAAAETN